MLTYFQIHWGFSPQTYKRFCILTCSNFLLVASIGVLKPSERNCTVKQEFLIFSCFPVRGENFSPFLQLAFIFVIPWVNLRLLTPRIVQSWAALNLLSGESVTTLHNQEISTRKHFWVLRGPRLRLFFYTMLIVSPAKKTFKSGHTEYMEEAT